MEVTVITVVRNAISAGRKVAFQQCLDSVQAQVEVDAEHLIVDGASDDGTLDLLADRRDGRIPLRVDSERDNGIYDAMNRGLRLARGKYVIFLNSDDRYCDTRGLADSVRALEDAGADFSFAPSRILSALDGREVEVALTHPDIRRIFVQMAFSHQTMMVRRELLLAHGGFDLRYRSSSDYDMVLRLILAGARGCAVNNRFAVFREGGFSYQNRDLAWREVGAIFACHYSQFSKGAISPEQGLYMYSSRYLPVEVQEQLRTFYERSFGQSGASALVRPRPRASFALLRKLAGFKFGLMTFKTGGSALDRLKAALMTAFRHPVWSLWFAALYWRAKHQVLPRFVAREAYFRMTWHILKRAAELPSTVNLVAVDDYWMLLGAYEPEPWGVWASRELIVRVPVPMNLRGRPVALTAYAGRFNPRRSEVARLAVSVNQFEVSCFDLESPVPTACRIDVPSSLTAVDELRVHFALDGDFRPCDHALGDDDRRLGISFSGLVIEGGFDGA